MRRARWSTKQGIGMYHASIFGCARFIPQPLTPPAVLLCRSCLKTTRTMPLVFRRSKQTKPRPTTKPSPPSLPSSPPSSSLGEPLWSSRGTRALGVPASNPKEHYKRPLNTWTFFLWIRVTFTDTMDPGKREGKNEEGKRQREREREIQRVREEQHSYVAAPIILFWIQRAVTGWLCCVLI